HPKKQSNGWKCMPYIIGNEMFEKIASTGLIANFTVYLLSHFQMKQIDATNLVQIFFGTTNFAPLVGAFVADAYLGRFRTLAYASVTSFLGMVALTLTAIVPELKPPSCTAATKLLGHCLGPSKAQTGALYFSLALLVIGAGGIRPCSLPFGVDQFDPNTKKDQEGLISFFNWYYCTSAAALVIGLTVLVYIQDNISWAIGFGIPTGFMLFSIIFFFLGVKLYVYVPPQGSIFSGIVQVFVASFKKRCLKLPSPHDLKLQEALLYNPPVENDRVIKLPLSSQFSFLNKAAIKSEDDEIKVEDNSPRNPWKLCNIQQIEEVKCLIRIIPIWFSGIICFLAMAQQWTFTILQSLTMDRHLGPHFLIPAGTIASISLISLTIFIPIYDRIFVPLARNFTKIDSGITLLQRQGVGQVFSIMAMLVAGLVEKKRRASALFHGGINGSSPLTAMWLAPQLVLMGIAEAFNAVGQIEFYNRQFPEHMQTLANSLFYCSLAGSSYLSTFIVTIVKKGTSGNQVGTSWLEDNLNVGRLDLFYYVIALMGVVNLIYFMVCAHFYRYKGVQVVVAGKVKEADIGVDGRKLGDTA
ncbi:Proton-dependent oligopeptide transporter family protein, partial [Dioscorea alata]